MAFFDKDLGKEDGGSLGDRLDTLVKLEQGKPVTIQVLEPRISMKNVIWRHYVPQALRKSGQRGIPVKCPGMDVCPICQQNKALGGDKTHPDYIAPQKRIAVNVLDLTPVRRCPVCGTDNEPKERECSNCGHTFTAEDRPIVPRDRVKIFERGVTVFTQLDMLEASVMTPYNPNDPLNSPELLEMNLQPGEMAPVGITRFPITMSVSGSGGKTVLTPVPGQVNDIDWRDYQDKLLDPQSIYIDLTPDEIKVLMDGGSLSEVLKGRGTATQGELAF